MNIRPVWFEPDTHQRYHATSVSAGRRLNLGGQLMTLCGLRCRAARAVPDPTDASPETLELLYCAHCRKLIAGV